MLYSKIEGQGNPLVILHGFLGMSDNWKSLGSQYAANGFQVHLLDLRNHGRSFHSPDFDYKVMVQDVFGYCSEHKLEQIAIIGHSMGGKVAMFLATEYPKLVEKLIVADIGPKYYAPHHDEILAGLKAVDFTKKPTRQEVDDVLLPFIPDFGTRQFLLKNLYWQEVGQLAFRFNLEVFNQKINEIGTTLPKDAVFLQPTLFISGGNSRYIIDNDLNDIEKHFPNYKLETIPNVGHWLHAENPKVFFEITLQFLK